MLGILGLTLGLVGTAGFSSGGQTLLSLIISGGLLSPSHSFFKLDILPVLLLLSSESSSSSVLPLGVELSLTFRSLDFNSAIPLFLSSSLLLSVVFGSNFFNGFLKAGSCLTPFSRFWLTLRRLALKSTGEVLVSVFGGDLSASFNSISLIGVGGEFEEGGGGGGEGGGEEVFSFGRERGSDLALEVESVDGSRFLRDIPKREGTGSSSSGGGGGGNSKSAREGGV